MIAILLLFINFSSWAIDRVDTLPTPWTEKENLFSRLDTKMIDAGSMLFFDSTLSRNNKVSCASCHVPSFAFSNGQEKALGFNGSKTEYNVPVLFNRIESKLQFWDGRVASLREQIFHPILNSKEMGMTEGLVLKRLNSSAIYRKLFGGKVTRTLVESALENFIFSLVSGNSRYDRYVAGETSILSTAELEGKNLFFETYKCNRCHSGPGFTNESLSLRCGSQENTYSARYKVPTLRNLQSSAPYLHNGRLETLHDVLDFYDQGNNENGFAIKADDKAKLVLFLNTLNAPIVSYYHQKKKNNH